MAEAPTDDTAGLIKNYKDVAAQSTITLESFDPDSQIVRASVEVREPPLVVPQMNAVKKLNLPDDSAIGQVTFQLGKLQVRDEALQFALDGIELNLLDLGPPVLNSKADNWKSEVPQEAKNVELTAEGSPRLYPFDKYLVIGRLDLPLRMSYQQKSVDFLWKNYRIESKLNGLLVEALSLDELKQCASDMKARAQSHGKRLTDQDAALEQETAALTKEAAVEELGRVKNFPNS